MTDARKIDAEVAVKVIGWKRPKGRRCATWTHPAGYGASESSIPHYSSNITGAMAVLEKMRERGFEVRIIGYAATDDSGGYGVFVGEHDDYGYALADLPLRICCCSLAALRAVGAERKDCGVQQKGHTDHKEKNE